VEKNVWWCVLPERCVYDLSLVAAMKVAYRMGKLGYRPVWAQYGRTDVTRQGLALAFMEASANPTDTLVMLDIDHDHPAAVVQRIVAHDVPVVVPLMFRRGEPYQACAFRAGPDGVLHHLATFPPGLHRMDGVGAGVIAIQRQVFERLRAAGHQWFFRYEYGPNLEAPSEDMYFSKICGEAGIEMYVDTTIETPHIALGLIDQQTHDDYMADNPDALGGLLSLANAPPVVSNNPIITIEAIL